MLLGRAMVCQRQIMITVMVGVIVSLYLSCIIIDLVNALHPN